VLLLLAIHSDRDEQQQQRDEFAFIDSTKLILCCKPSSSFPNSKQATKKPSATAAYAS